MGMKAIEATRYLVDKLQIQDQVSPEEFLRQREAALDGMFPSAELLPGKVLITMISRSMDGAGPLIRLEISQRWYQAVLWLMCMPSVWSNSKAYQLLWATINQHCLPH